MAAHACAGALGKLQYLEFQGIFAYRRDRDGEGRGKEGGREKGREEKNNGRKENKKREKNGRGNLCEKHFSVISV